MSPREHLAQDAFKIEETLTLFGRPIGVLIIGSWQGDVCELMVGMMALEPFDFCRIVAAARFAPGERLSVVRTAEENDPRDDDGVIERYFEKPMAEIMTAIFGQLHDAFAEAAELREDRAEAADEMPVRETPATSTWMH